MTLGEAADALDYPEAYVRELAEAGRLPSFTANSELVFSKTALEQWILGLTKG